MYPTLVSLAVFIVFAMGVMCGASWAEQILSARSQRQAELQRELNQQVLALREEWRRLQA
jgi:hypothetical protein